ncbi:MAG: hypothetical protein Ct9H90mP27_4620 [Gammaproteobacteria bacterium]|nr:MAG: hypothetical protein Ct9H90mP27_4620 [Gammaproteobacteria bacterium]
MLSSLSIVMRFMTRIRGSGHRELIIGKQRNGPIGKVRVSYIGHLTKFEDLAAERYNDFT